MCWRMILLAGVVAVAAYHFNPHDQSDYIDDPDDEEVTKESIPITDAATRVKKGDKLEDDIEKLLGQPIVHYEEPDAIAHPSTGPTDDPASEGRSHSSSTRKSTPPSKTTGIPHWNEAQEEQAGHSTFRQKRNRAQRTSEAVYSVHVPQWDDSYPHVGRRIRPGVIESLVGAHDIVRFETRNNPIRPPYIHTTRAYSDPTRTYDELSTYKPSRTSEKPWMKKEEESTSHIEDRTLTANETVSWTAYNEGGFRSLSPDSGASVGGRRQYLVTVPAYLASPTTRRPRPTPVSLTMLTTPYLFTRRTRRHPNCTDSYYECLDKCFDKRGYRVDCPWKTPEPRPEPARFNFTGLFWAIQQEKRITQYEVSNIFWSFRDQLLEKSYRPCRTTTPKTTTFPKVYPIYYDDSVSKETGRIMAKCWVCGLLDKGIPSNANCYDNFANSGLGSALAEKASYRRYCRYMDEVPLWFNRSDPFSVWGQWTGGCTYRFLDLSGLYAQRACRSTIIPAEGQHYLSRRMARLELALRDENEGCVVSPMATLVPFSRAVSLYARFTVCVCRGSWCNRACRRAPSLALLFIFIIILRGLVC